MRRALPYALLALGCDDHPAPPRVPPLPPRPLALRQPAAAPAESPGESPPAAPDDDAVGRCVRRNRASLGPELGRALAALGDDALLEDSCGLDLAVRARDPARCAALHLSSLRETCAFRASVVAARPEACPAAPGLRGRDPVCVALAARDASLCAAASAGERARCHALAAGDRRPCDALDPLLAPACARDLDALRPLLAPLPRGATRAPDPSRNGWSTPVGDASVASPVAWLPRGVFVDEAGAVWLVDPGLGWPSPGALALDQPLVGVTFAARRGSALVTEARLVAGASPAFSTADGSLRAEVTLTQVPRGRGSRAAGAVIFDGVVVGRAVHAELRFDTFVRDVVTAASLR